MLSICYKSYEKENTLVSIPVGLDFIPKPAVEQACTPKEYEEVKDNELIICLGSPVNPDLPDGEDGDFKFSEVNRYELRKKDTDEPDSIKNVIESGNLERTVKEVLYFALVDAYHFITTAPMIPCNIGELLVSKGATKPETVN